MGIADRDYVRYERRPTFFGRDGWDVVVWIIVINAAVIVLQRISTRDHYSVVTEWLALAPQQVLHGQIWRLATYDFLHSVGNPWHILINMYVLFIAGRRLLSMYSPREFVLFYLSAGVLSGVAFVAWQLLRGHQNPAIGASGAVAAVMVLYAMYHPREVWMIFGVIPVPVMVLVGLAAVLDLYPILAEMGEGHPQDGIAHAAHLGGMLFGFLYYKGQWRLEDLLPNMKRGRLRQALRRKPPLRVHRPEDDADPIDTEELQERVDGLLEKIHTEGEQSLTEEDRKILNTASRILRDRRNKVT